MSEDLDDFLRQAAERRQKRQQQQQNRSSPAPAPQVPPKPPRSAAPRPQAPVSPYATPTPQRNTRPKMAEVVSDEPTVVGHHLAGGLANRTVASDLSQSDERMEEHLKQVFGSNANDVRAAKNRRSGSKHAVDDMSAYAPIGAVQSSAMVTSMDLKQQLRDPQTLRLAVIAFEILRRPYQ